MNVPDSVFSRGPVEIGDHISAKWAAIDVRILEDETTRDPIKDATQGHQETRLRRRHSTVNTLLRNRSIFKIRAKHGANDREMP